MKTYCLVSTELPVTKGVQREMDDIFPLINKNRKIT